MENIKRLVAFRMDRIFYARLIKEKNVSEFIRECILDRWEKEDEATNVNK